MAMSGIGWIVIIGIIIVIVMKNIDKIIPIIQKIFKKPEKKETIEITQQDIKLAKEEKIKWLMDSKRHREEKIRQMIEPIRKEIKQIDIEIYLLTGEKR